MHLLGRAMTVQASGAVSMCEHYGRNTVIGNAETDNLLALYNGSFMNTQREYFPVGSCLSCNMAYSGHGMYGSIRFKGIEQEIFYKKDFYNEIYSLRDVKEGISWEKNSG